ncbi:LANO_0C07030g1_1 [Lachancea nothofagi CBS 11611]|uniref:3beta-hydroxysteroid 3-dehydrogenase n=1 Tax=Lachancea nothofagi CBS 11611 TaxID=1266666 RepID=A0A1G4J8G7_9SACH|nr:LANO_0C07030g1_1 [Lachancea nothofagi CBS 11611]
MTEPRKVAVITGTNSNLGLNIAYRLIEEVDRDVRLTIVVTSRTLPRAREVIDQIQQFVKKSQRPGPVDYDYLLVDFTDMVSVLGAYYDLNKQYKEIHYFFVNAAQGVYSGIDWLGAVKEVFTSPIEAVTNPTYKIQRVGVKSQDGMGLVFQANVFGPYYLIQKILPQLRAGKAVVVWISSIMSNPKYLSLDDIELRRSPASYEGSKRLVDLMHLATYKDLKSQGIKQYIVQPGIFISHSFFKYLNVLSYYGMLLLFYLARFMGSPWHNIDGYRAANAPVYVATMANPVFEQQDVKYGSATDKGGLEYIRTEEIEPTGVQDVYSYINKLKEDWDGKLKDQITNSRQV